jgi:hypothetical protein
MNEAQTATERDELTDLIKHPGFLRFAQHVQSEWGTGLSLKMKQAVKDAKAANEDREVAVEKVDYAGDQIAALLNWPRDRVAQLTAQPDKRPFFNLRRA